MSNIAVVTTFANQHFELYAKKMLESFVQYWPKEVILLVQLDDHTLLEQVQKITRPQDAVMVGRSDTHQEFIKRNAGKDDVGNYRKQPVRFCHKVFSIKNAFDAVENSRKQAIKDTPRYLVWLDADVHTTKPVSLEELKSCLPKEGDAVSYLGRKDWPHSECGWLAFDLLNGGGDVVAAFHNLYVTDAVMGMKEQHDSWVFDQIQAKKTNLTEDKPGMDIWPHSPMGKWSTHYKGPVAKNNLAAPYQTPMPQHAVKTSNGSNVVIQTKNSIPDAEIQAHIAENQKLIKNWVRECLPTDEELVVVSAGPQLIAEDVRKESGKKIVAVKHALGPLKKAGITPWACILLDPRPHVANFVTDPDPDVLWIVASQVDPKVTLSLLAHGCEVWGYHAAVGAGEHKLTAEQPDSIISGGSATATRGLYLLHHLGFRKFKLYGYELSLPDKPDLNARDNEGQPKYLEFAVAMNHSMHNVKKTFFSEPQLMAQFEEFRQLIDSGKMELDAEGDGIIPFLIKSKKIGDLRLNELKAKINGGSLTTHERLFKWKKTSKMDYPAVTKTGRTKNFWTRLLKR